MWETTKQGLKDRNTEASTKHEARSRAGAQEARSAGTEEPPSDQMLVAMSREGNGAAFGQLIQRYHSACVKKAVLMMRNRGDAEDEVQNAYWKAFQCLDQFRGEGSFSAWLSRIVENQCLMRIRSERSATFVHLDEASDANVRLELVGETRDPEDQLGWSEVAALVRRETSRMPPLLRNVMVLRDLEQLPMPDVAARLGLSVPAAKSRLMRARIELRARVKRHCGKKGQGTLMQRTRYKRWAYAGAA